MNMARLGWLVAAAVLVFGGVERTRAADPAKGPDPDNKDQQLLVVKPHQSMTYCVAYSPDGKRIASGSQDDTAAITDAETGKVVYTLKGHKQGVNSVAFSPDGKKLATAAGDKTVKIWAVSNGRELLTLKGHKLAVQDVAFSPDGKTVASCAGDVGRATQPGEIRLWDAESGK